ncbi:MAG: MBL fold metallo-hydrolase [Candidatus Shapirobacteria bacterium]
MKKYVNKIILLGIGLLIWGIYLGYPGNEIKLIFCDVGQGDGAMIVRGKNQVLIDVGADNGKMVKCMDRYLPFWDKKIEMLIISHWDEDHSGALKSLVKSYQFENLIESTVSTQGYEKMIDSKVVKAGDRLGFKNWYIDIISPRENTREDNASSIVMVANFAEGSFLFSGDAEFGEEGEMLSWWKREVDGIKISHHGSAGASSWDWLLRLRPSIAVISVGENNFGHPSKDLIDKLNKIGANIYRTDKNGDIVLKWN